MVAHQLVAYGLFILPVCIMWEKLVKTHYKPLWLRLPSRLPVGETLGMLVLAESNIAMMACIWESCEPHMASDHQQGELGTTQLSSYCRDAGACMFTPLRYRMCLDHQG